jgi:hypothetical protein
VLAYQYAIKMEQNLKQKTLKFGLGNPLLKNPRKGGPNLQNKGQRKDKQPHDNQSSLEEKKDTRKTKKNTGKWCDFHKSPSHKTVDCHSKQSLVVDMKAYELDVVSDSESELERGKQIIEAEPSAIVATTNIHPSEPYEPEEGEHIFH